MVFSCRELLFSKLFSCERPQATEILEKSCFSGISDGTGRRKGELPAGSSRQQAAAGSSRHKQTQQQ